MRAVAERDRAILIVQGVDAIGGSGIRGIGDLLPQHPRSRAPVEVILHPIRIGFLQLLNFLTAQRLAHAQFEALGRESAAAPEKRAASESRRTIPALRWLAYSRLSPRWR